MTQNEFLKSLKYITPFTFADPVGIFKADYELPWVNLLIFMGLAITGFISALLCFKKRDILI
jgi:ABC-type transport system involved in multi-copper enzyme maturation permease subunit